MYERLAILLLVCFGGSALLLMRMFDISSETEYAEAGQRQSSYTLMIYSGYGQIYDRNMNSFTDKETKYIAVVNPESEEAIRVLPIAADKEEFREKLQGGSPFFCEVSSPEISADGVSVISVPIRYVDNTAAHILGYSSDGRGVSGLEMAYDELLRGYKSEITATFSVDGTGDILGSYAEISYNGSSVGGVVTTLDARIQKIAEDVCDEYLDSGAVVIMNPENCEILAMVSRPSFLREALEESLNEENSPFLNRAISEYSVGSAFKLAVASAALDEGISEDFTYECTGETEVGGLVFHCHNREGHGELDMAKAVAKSCNTYFIELSRRISPINLISRASLLGFGKSVELCPGITSAAGSLQSEEELKNEGELANLSFGQGALSATPVQIAAMTCAFANGGRLAQPRLIYGTTEDGVTIDGTSETVFINAMPKSTADKVLSFMALTAEDSLAEPGNTTAAVKTSTAQTGRFHKDGSEIINSWITGVFPAEKPKYTVTVLADDSIGGNVSCGPIFKEIAERITEAGL